jgi:hypothetical protein
MNRFEIFFKSGERGRRSVKGALVTVASKEGRPKVV